MPDNKSFERNIPFIHVQGNYWCPIVKVAFLSPNPRRLELYLLFDTGADHIVLHPEWEFAFPNLKEKDYTGLSGKAKGKTVQGQIEFYGHIIGCEIGFGPKEMERRTWMAGLFGRDCFKSFGFGFWERDRQLYVTARP
jgi:hypothetical protein